MVLFRSRKLEMLLGHELGEGLSHTHIQGLVGLAREAVDLELKRETYGNADKDKRELAADVAAMANSAGGVIIIGVAEDQQGQAVAAEGVLISDAEERRLTEIILSNVVPLVKFSILPIPLPSAEAATRGFFLILVSPSSLAPHAVRVDKGFRYPRRSGTIKHWLSEPEVAAAYAQRVAGEQRLAHRVAEVDDRGVRRLERGHLPWVSVTIAPEIGGDFVINNDTAATFDRATISEPVGIGNPRSRWVWTRTGVGMRCLTATCRVDERFNLASMELHTDGSGFYAEVVTDLNDKPGRSIAPGNVRVAEHDEVMVAVLSGLERLAFHAHDHAGAAGSVSIRARVIPTNPGEFVQLGADWGFAEVLGERVNGDVSAVTTAALEDLVPSGPGLITVAKRLCDEICQTMGIPEARALTHDGLRKDRLRPATVGRLTGWAETHDVPLL